MKSVFISFALSLLGCLFFVTISVVYTYSTAYLDNSYVLRHALKQAAKEAIIPQIEIVEVPCDDEEDEECIDGFCLMEVITYMEADEFFDILCNYIADYEVDDLEKKLRLLHFENDPLAVKGELVSRYSYWFYDFEVRAEEVLIEERE